MVAAELFVVWLIIIGIGIWLIPKFWNKYFKEPNVQVDIKKIEFEYEDVLTNLVEEAKKVEEQRDQIEKREAELETLVKKLTTKQINKESKND